MKDTTVMNLDLSQEINETKRILTEGFQRGLREVVRTQQIVEKSFTSENVLAEEVIDVLRHMEPGSGASDVHSAEVKRRSAGIVGRELIPIFKEVMNAMQEVEASDALHTAVTNITMIRKQGGAMLKKSMSDLSAKDYVEYLLSIAPDTSIFGESHRALATTAREKIAQKISQLLSDFPNNQTIKKSAHNFKVKFGLED